MQNRKITPKGNDVTRMNEVCKVNLTRIVIDNICDNKIYSKSLKIRGAIVISLELNLNPMYMHKYFQQITG